MMQATSIQKETSTSNRTMHDGEMFESLWDEEAIKKEIERAKTENDIPRFKLDKIEMHISKECNLHCGFCYGKDVVPEIGKRRWLSKDKVKEVLEDVRENMRGQNPIIMYAGLYSEPLLHNKIEEIINETAEKNYRFGLYTNGIKLTEPLMETLIQCAKATATIETKPSYVSFNITALMDIDPSMKEPDCINVLKNIKCLSEMNTKEKPLVVNASLLAIEGFHERDYSDVVKKLIDSGIDNIRFSFPWVPVPQKNQSRTGLERDEYQRASKLFLSNKRMYPDKITIRNPAKDFDRCFVGTQGISISSEGDVFFCPEVSSLRFKRTHSYGSIYTNKISEIWQNKDHKEKFLTFDPYTIDKECICCHMDNVFNRYCSKFWRNEDTEEVLINSDIEFMKLAIEEAKKSKQEKGKTPLYVGVAVVKDGEVLAKAHRGELAQGEHAEYTALERKLIDTNLSGATIYTTLEPCTTRSHPKVPCATRIVQRRLGKVVVGILDPNPNIRGNGVWILSESKIIVEHFPHELQEEIRNLNRAFITEQRDA